jgi:hypothetical protein
MKPRDFFTVFRNLRRCVLAGGIIFLQLQLSLAYAQMPIVGNFESGQFQESNGRVDAFWVRTLPDPQSGAEYISTGSGGGAPNSGWDVRVVSRQNVGGETIMPRRGNYFASFVIDRDKNYLGLNGGQKDRPRAELHARADHMMFDFDTEVWLGVSIYVPRNFQDELVNNHQGGMTLISTNSDSAASFMSLRIHVPQGANESHWMLKTHTDDQSVTDSEESKTFTDLGPISSDAGKWTDFVFRMRVNPFSVDTNPAKEGIKLAFNHLYRGNKGILQIWKAEGNVDQSGNRRMVQKLNILNAPIGLVPGVTQDKTQLHSSMRIYKSQWKILDTVVDRPIWLGYDEFRLGQAVRDSVGYADVHPSGQACTDNCPGGKSGSVLAPPRPPRNLKISD